MTFSKTSVVLLLLAMLACLVVAQTRPSIPEVFQAKTTVEIELVATHEQFVGQGVWYVDQPEGKALEFWTFEKAHHLDQHDLERWDLGKAFQIESGSDACHEIEIGGSMPLVWGWVANSSYAGKQEVDHHSYDKWVLDVGYARSELLVDPSTPNVPVYMSRYAPAREVHVQFDDFSSFKPNATVFSIPSNCQSQSLTGPDACVERTTIHSRAKVWVEHHVPYNQGGHYDGYREDCSGYVSYCWEGPKPGWTTETMVGVTKYIGKDRLKVGDVLLCASEHVVLFGGWADSDHSHYHAYEETRPGEGTVARVTPFPYWYNTGCFKPARYEHACA